MAVGEHGGYRIQGRNSVDIIKTGGYKVSVLEIEGRSRGPTRISGNARSWGSLMRSGVSGLRRRSW